MNSLDSTRSCHTLYQDGEEMVKVVQPECLFLKISERSTKATMVPAFRIFEGELIPRSNNVMMWIILCMQVVHKHVSCVML